MPKVPRKLKPGDVVRVVAPACSLSIIDPEIRQRAVESLTSMGFTVTFGAHVEELDLFSSSSIESRVSDLHEAFVNPGVAGILSVIGGYNSNQLLRSLDYDLIAAHPKVFCGFSDITALSNAILAKSDLVTYSGPHFSTFGKPQPGSYTQDYFKRCLCSESSFVIEPADVWVDTRWENNQERQEQFTNQGFGVVQSGFAEGRIIGGNLCTLNLLQGTEYMPSLKDTILFLEDDDEVRAATFDRDLQSLIHQPGFEGVRGIVVGRFQNASGISRAEICEIFRSKRELVALPIIVDLDFGHTYPQITYPIGGSARIEADESGAIILEIGSCGVGHGASA
jgi:muramoyltetrapeptide carboxypeptidase LdcA involved in peptidoglycan recycling